MPVTSHCVDADGILAGLERPDPFHVAGEPRAFHLSLTSTVEPVVDVLIFQLLVLEDLVDSAGRHWRPEPADAFFIELPSESAGAVAESIPVADKLSFCFLLPGVKVSIRARPLPPSFPGAVA